MPAVVSRFSSLSTSDEHTSSSLMHCMSTENFVVGALLGMLDGAEVGMLVGASDGAEVGFMVGEVVGMLVGASVGEYVGFKVG